MEAPIENASIGSAARKGVPQDHAHSAISAGLLLFPRDHVRKAPAQEFALLDLVRDTEYDFANLVVDAQIPAGGPIGLFKILLGKPFEDRGHRGGGVHCGAPVRA